MYPPQDDIEIAEATIWLRDGILIEFTKDVPSSFETVAEASDGFRDLGGRFAPPLPLRRSGLERR